MKEKWTWKKKVIASQSVVSVMRNANVLLTVANVREISLRSPTSSYYSCWLPVFVNEMFPLILIRKIWRLELIGSAAFDDILNYQMIIDLNV